MRPIGKNIRDLRIRQNITQETLAEMLFVTRQTVSNYETGRSQPDIGMLLKIADALGVDANALIYGSPKPPVTNRRAAYIRMAVGGGIFTALCIVALAVGPVEQRYFGFNMWTEALLNSYDLRVSILYPSILLTAGWCALQALSLLLRFEPPKWKASVFFKWAIVALLALATIMMLIHTFNSYLLHALRNHYHPHFDLYTDLQQTLRVVFRIPLYTEMERLYIYICYPFPWTHFLLGAALWLFAFPRRVKAKPAPEADPADPPPESEQQKTEP